jgi:hypothetical protein
MELSEIVRVQGGIKDGGSARFVDSRTRRGMDVVESEDLWAGDKRLDHSQLR